MVAPAAAIAPVKRIRLRTEVVRVVHARVTQRFDLLKLLRPPRGRQREALQTEAEGTRHARLYHSLPGRALAAVHDIEGDAVLGDLAQRDRGLASKGQDHTLELSQRVLEHAAVALEDHA